VVLLPQEMVVLLPLDQEAQSLHAVQMKFLVAEGMTVLLQIRTHPEEILPLQRPQKMPTAAGAMTDLIMAAEAAVAPIPLVAAEIQMDGVNNGNNRRIF